MLILSSQRAGAIIDTNTRGRPQVTGGTLRTDTGLPMRSGRFSGDAAAATDAAVWAQARALGLNTMRCGFKVGNQSLATVHARLDKIVDAARNNRMYVLLCNAETSPAAWEDNIAANKAKQIENWTSVAARYKDETHVFYDQINEPEGWGLWSHYAANATTPTDLLIALREVHDVIRSNAPDTVALMPSAANLQASGGAQQYVNAIRAFESIGPVDWTRTVWSFHYYNQTRLLGVNNNSATDGGRAGLAWLKAQYPIVCTETNWFIDKPPREWLVDAADAMEDAGVGWAIMRYPGQTGDTPSSLLGPDFIVNKVNQLRDRGYVIPVE